MAKKLIFIGLINQDIDRTPTKETTAPGGAVYFAALAAARNGLNENVEMVGRVGTDFDLMQIRKKIGESGIIVDAEMPSTKSIQIYHSDTDLTDRDIEFEPGASLQLTPNDIPKHWLTSENFFHIATMPPAMQGMFVDFFNNHPEKLSFSIDTDLTFLSDEENLKQVKHNFAEADLVFVNRREAEALGDVLPKLKQVILKLDKDGAQFWQAGQKLFDVSCPKVEVVNATGAGDILAGTYLSNKELKEMSEEEALTDAIAQASLATTYEHKEDFLFEL
ncbi:MAG: carbohydrate kinase family protein [Pseudomonadales bacterium]|jgi:sugar/nucleoside kinase (ribokinase family)|nr:carbohydrate kinase family protein [Pseudomonadales bacterium]